MSERDAWKEVGKLALRVIRKGIQTYLEEAERKLEEAAKAREQKQTYTCKECGASFNDRLSLYEHGNMAGHEVE